MFQSVFNRKKQSKMEVKQETLSPPDPFVFTENAANKVKDVLKSYDEEEQKQFMLRVFVQGGGCSGFQYGFTIEEKPEEDDTVYTKHGVKVVIDSMSYSYLIGSEIDYKDDLNGSSFVIRNPQATSTCGCGSSFAAG
tara:strand:+ start:359 stop:769 length:411 start_codon:yes stop_codon:yes gene_type:complete